MLVIDCFIALFYEEEKIIIKLLKVGQWIDSLTKHIAQYNTISNILLFIIIIFPH